MNKLRRPSKANLILWLLIALMLTLVIFSIVIRRKETVAEPVKEKEYAVQLIELKAKDLADMLLLPGRVEPDYRGRLPAVKPGQVTEILVERGDSVTNGQLLLRVDSRLWETMRSNAEIELREAEREFGRWNELDAAGAVSGSGMDQIRNRLDRARNAVKEAATHVTHCEVRSPVDGIINHRYIELGEYAKEGEAVFEVVVVNPVKIVIEIPERDAASAYRNGPIMFTASVLPGRVFTGIVTFAASAAPANNNAFRMEITANNDHGLLKPGMIVDVHYQRGMLKDALAVPLDAVIPRAGEHYVFVERDNRAVRRLIRMDRITGSDAVISEGLQSGERVVVKGNRVLEDGSLIRPINPDPATATGETSTP